MKGRCLTPTNRKYPDYGGRGISICKDWRDDFVKFYNWSIDNGYKKGLTIERKDVNGDYCPENCCLIPLNEQNDNKRNSLYVEINGKTISLIKLAKKYNIDSCLLYYRLTHGMNLEDAISKPKIRPKIIINYCGNALSLKKWSELSGIKDSTLSKRYKKGLPLEYVFRKRNGETFVMGALL